MRLIIHQTAVLSGTVTLAGAKNSALRLLAASLLTEGQITQVRQLIA